MQLDKAIKSGIMHNDIKRGNVLINSHDKKFNFFDVQLIDWNLASFYYHGADIGFQKGTACYYSPE